MEASNQQHPEVFRQDILSFWNTYKKTFCCLLILHIVGISAIIRANVPYIDDVGRAAYGYRNFQYGRILADFFAVLVHAGTFVRDISPLTQILAVCFLSAACCIVIHLLSEKRGFDLWTIIAVLPLGLSPYFLECLSYKFDSPYMALSILVSVIPFLFLKYGFPLYGAVSVIGCLYMCMLYQSSSGIYPMLTALLCFRQWNKGRPLKDVLRFCLVSALSYCLALAIFRLLFASGDPTASGYVNFSISLSQLPKNLRTYFLHIQGDFKPWWLALAALIAASFVYASVRDTARKPRLLSGLLAAAALLAMLLLSFGAYSFFETPLFSPRAMYGFSVFIAFTGVYASSAKQIYSARLACLCLSWAFFVFAFIYGNALAENQRYLEFRVESAIRDISETEACLAWEQGGELPHIQYCGTIDLSPTISRGSDSYGLLSRLIPTVVSGGWAHGKTYVQWYFGLAGHVTVDFADDFQDMDLPILKDTLYHTIRGDSEHILIEFKH